MLRHGVARGAAARHRVRLMAAQSLVRRRFLEFLVSVVMVHVIFIAMYYALDLRHWTVERQRVFAWIWMAATIAVVFVGLQRIKRARRARSGPSTAQL